MAYITACYAFHNKDVLWELGACHFLDILYVLTEERRFEEEEKGTKGRTEKDR